MIPDEPKLLVIGTSHKTASIYEREKLQINRKEIRGVLDYFKSFDGVEGAVIVSTCNRLEFYFVLNNLTDPFTVLNPFYKKERNIDLPTASNNFYIYSGTDTARHLFRVISGLDSMIIGEYQVQGQIKDAYSIACSAKAPDKILHKLFHAAFRTGKAVRTQTKIGQGNQSLSGVASSLLKERLNKTDPVTIIGINKNTQIIAQRLFESGFSHLCFVNRTFYKAEEMAGRYLGKAFGLEQLEEALTGSKCILSCTGSPDFIIHSELLNEIFSKTDPPELIIDMAVPRDIEVDGISGNVKILDLEGLGKYLGQQQKEIILDLPEAERIITAESRIFEVWNQAQSDSTFAWLDEKMEIIRLQLLNEKKIQLSEEEYNLLDRFSRSLIHRMKSTVTRAVKNNLDDADIYKAG